MVKGHELPKAPFRRLIKKAGGVLISAEAIDYMMTATEKWIIELTKKSLRLTEHAGRKKLTLKDVQMAQDI